MPGKAICRVCGREFQYHSKRKRDRCYHCGWSAWTVAHNSMIKKRGRTYEKWKAGMIAAANRGK